MTPARVVYGRLRASSAPSNEEKKRSSFGSKFRVFWRKSSNSTSGGGGFAGGSTTSWSDPGMLRPGLLPADEYPESTRLLVLKQSGFSQSVNGTFQVNTNLLKGDCRRNSSSEGSRLVITKNKIHVRMKINSKARIKHVVLILKDF